MMRSRRVQVASKTNMCAPLTFKEEKIMKAKWKWRSEFLRCRRDNLRIDSKKISWRLSVDNNGINGLLLNSELSIYSLSLSKSA